MHRLAAILGTIVMCISLLAVCCGVGQAAERVLRAGIVGCDTSHVIQFAKLINDPQATGARAEVQVTVAYPGGSPDLPASRDRVADFVAQLRKQNIAIVDSLDALAEQCDVVLLESVDGRVHYDQFRAIAKGKPVFVDKPAAASLADVIAIFRRADETHTPVFTASALRFGDEVRTLAKQSKIGKLLGCETVGPLKIEPHHPDLFWYGIHGVEPLFTIMGKGCETVACTDTEKSALVVGKWRDGRVGVYRGLKYERAGYAAATFGTKGTEFLAGFSGYDRIVDEICEFFISGKEPVSRAETIEIFAFMEASDESKRLGGQPVAIQEMIQRAEQAAKGKVASSPDSDTRKVANP